MKPKKTVTIHQDNGNGFKQHITLIYEKWGIFASVRQEREGKEDTYTYKRFYLSKNKPTYKEVRTEIDIYFNLL